MHRNHEIIMKFNELKKSDKVLVQCPIDKGEWITEVLIEDSVIGEDMYEGSGRWFIRIITDNCVNPCIDSSVLEGKHWSALMLGKGDFSEGTCKANPRFSFRIKTIN